MRRRTGQRREGETAEDEGRAHERGGRVTVRLLLSCKGFLKRASGEVSGGARRESSMFDFTKTLPSASTLAARTRASQTADSCTSTGSRAPSSRRRRVVVVLLLEEGRRTMALLRRWTSEQRVREARVSDDDRYTRTSSVHRRPSSSFLLPSFSFPLAPALAPLQQPGGVAVHPAHSILLARAPVHLFPDSRQRWTAPAAPS